jgi:lysozyme
MPPVLHYPKLVEQLLVDEGLRLKPYRDTVGKLTIGVGRNLDDRGITEVEARYLLVNDIKVAEEDLTRNAPWWRNLDEPRQGALLNMCLNLGWPRLSRFEKMLEALKAKDYDKAAAEALDSKWATQVGDRAKRIAKELKGD